MIKKIFLGFLGFVAVMYIIAAITTTPEDKAQFEAKRAEETRVAGEKRKEREKIKPEQLAAIGVYGKTKDNLRDPDSLKVDTVMTSTSPEAVTACMEFRARNGFNGMNRGQAVWVLAKGGKFYFAVDNNKLWNKWCANKTMNDQTALMQTLHSKVSKK